MQIHEITRLDEAGMMDTMAGWAAQGLSKMMGMNDPNKLAATQQAKIADVAKRALPLWQAKRTQLERSLGTGRVDFDAELESWLEDNILRRNLALSQMDPQYQKAIRNQIYQVNNVQSEPLRLEAFKKLIATATMARPSRSQAAQYSGIIPLRQQGGRISIGQYQLNPNDPSDKFVLAYLQQKQPQIVGQAQAQSAQGQQP